MLVPVSSDEGLRACLPKNGAPTNLLRVKLLSSLVTMECILCRYRMDYLKFVEHHRATNADITIGCLPVDYERASDFGLMKIDDEGRIYVSACILHCADILKNLLRLERS